MPNPSVISQLLLSATEAARACGVGRSLWLQLDSSGRVPQAVRLGRRKLWRTDELSAWVQAGLPARDRWEYKPYMNKT